ncbi:MAG: maleylacetoacetate isomerase [Anaeromyxobacter sp.]|nr:maleylacetoacetate isomerase [Anaeromyxobacter sp.]MBL0277528.1 maleylacetoacetate isomerase [Anaeromyxobacter sp.]
MTLRLYGYWRSSSAWRVRLGLALKGLPYQSVAVNLLAGEQDAPDHVARSPLHHVPVLEVLDGATPLRLVQSMAILEWLEEVHPAPPLLPGDPAGRARVRALAEHVNSGIQPYQNTAALTWLRERHPGTELAWVRHWIGRGLAGLEASVGERAGAFCHGDAPGLADCYLVPQLYAARRFQVDLAPFPRLRAVEAACAALPALQAAHPDRQPDAPPPEARTA